MEVDGSERMHVCTLGRSHSQDYQSKTPRIVLYSCRPASLIAVWGVELEKFPRVLVTDVDHCA